MDVSFNNYKEKYNVVFGVFNGGFKISIMSSEKDRTKYAEIPLNFNGLRSLVSIAKGIERDAPGKTQSVMIGTYNKEARGFDYTTIIGFKKNDNLMYSFFVDIKVGGANKLFQVPLMSDRKFLVNSEVYDEKESSAQAIKNLIVYLDQYAIVDMAVGERDKEAYFTKTTMGNIATKVGAEIAKPKFRQGGNFGGGGGGGYKAPNSNPPQQNFNNNSAPAPSDDEIPF